MDSHWKSKFILSPALFQSLRCPSLGLSVNISSTIVCSKILLMAACCTWTPEVPQTETLIRLSFKRLLVAGGRGLDTLGGFHCFVPLTPVTAPSLPLGKACFWLAPFSVLRHLSQGSLLRAWLLPCWEQVVTASGC